MRYPPRREVCHRRQATPPVEDYCELMARTGQSWGEIPEIRGPLIGRSWVGYVAHDLFSQVGEISRLIGQQALVAHRIPTLDAMSVGQQDHAILDTRVLQQSAGQQQAATAIQVQFGRAPVEITDKIPVLLDIKI